MNEKEITAIKKEAQSNYACDCKNNINKPLAFVCISCGKCYHLSCAIKIKNAYHIKGNLFCCCYVDTEFLQQDYEILKNEMQEEKRKSASLMNENKSLIEDLNKLHLKVNTNEELVTVKQQYFAASEKLDLFKKENTKLNNMVLELKKQIQIKNDSVNNTLTKSEKEALDEIILSKSALCDSLQENIKNLQNSFITENDLLKNLNESLQLNNKLLIDKVQNLEIQINNKSVGTKTYAKAVSENKENFNFIQHTPNFIVSAQSEMQTDKLYQEVKDKIQKEILVPITNLKHNNYNKTVSFRCCNLSDIENTKSKLLDSLGDNYKVEIEKLQNPRIKIVGITNDMKIEDIEKDINQRNFAEFDKQCSIIHTYKTKKETTSMIVDLPSELHVHIRNNNYKIFVGTERCRVFDYFDLTPCSNCCRTGHSSKKCTNDVVCIFCSKNHKFESCDTINVQKCSNCIYNNNKFNTNKDINHAANDTNNCETLKLKLNNLIHKTDYPIMPLIPKYLGVHIKKYTNLQQTTEKNENQPASNNYNNPREFTNKKRFNQQKQRNNYGSSRRRNY